MASSDPSENAPTPGVTDAAGTAWTERLRARVASLSQIQLIAAVGGVLFLGALLVGALMWERAPEDAVLFSNLDQRDGGQIISTLQQQNVPYRISPGGDAILVPADRVHETRMLLASSGLPAGGTIGFELLDEQKLGISQFGEQVNYQRGLEGELARTIRSIAAIESARVHLAIPRQTAFLRDQQMPSASVFVNLRSGYLLDADQLAGIVNLVSSSVPRMDPAKVNVINQEGELLTGSARAKARIGMDASELAYVRQIEADYVDRIKHILEPMFGEGNYRAQVNADIDFNEVEQTAETFRPNPVSEQSIRSQQISEETSTDPTPIGVPGALSNQPPVPATAPITDPPVEEATAQRPLTSSRSALTNYELDRTVAHIKRSVGQIRRLSVAVVINERALAQDPEGFIGNAFQLTTVENLVREAVGIQDERGDTIAVSQSSFQEEVVAPIPFWKDPEMLQLLDTLLTWVMVLITLLVLYFILLRPVLNAVLPQRETPRTDEALPEGPERVEVPTPDAKENADENEDEADDDVRVTLSGAAPADDAPLAPREPAPELEIPEPPVVAESLPAVAELSQAAPPEEPAAQTPAETRARDPRDEYAASLERAREIARGDPRLVANLIREWMKTSDAQRAS
ncbi:MAG: flagellar basal body M-ring protein FliF [Gammaproteobacteria bacterium]|nr:flagellar basal body M-ring protein FliF [Gammaproteobacteria bacterium]